MSDQVALETMTTVELTMWLQSKGFGAAVQTAFEEEEMDGEAVMAAFATCSGPDCIKDIINYKTYGSRLKVYTALKAALEKVTSKVSLHSNLPSPLHFQVSHLHLYSISRTFLVMVMTPLSILLLVSLYSVCIRGESECFSTSLKQCGIS